MSKLKFITSALVIVLFFQSCATIIHGSSQEVEISSKPSNAKVIIDGNTVGSTPVAVNLKRKNSYKIRVSLDGYRQHNAELVSTFSFWTLGNFITFPPGIIIDFVTGGSNGLTPDKISVELNKTLFKINDKIIWVKPTQNILSDINSTGINSDYTIVVLHNGTSDPILESIYDLKQKYELIFQDLKWSDSVNDLERLRSDRPKMNFLANSNNTKLAIAYLNEYPQRVNKIIFRGENPPNLDYEPKEDKALPITKEQLVESAEYGKLDEVQYLLDSGLDPNHPSKPLQF